MSRAFVAASSQYVASASPIVTAYPFTVSLWVKPTSIGAFQVFWYNGDTAGNVDYWFVGMDASGYPVLTTRNTGGVNTSVASTTQLTVGAWHNIVAVFASATDRRLYVNNDAGVQDTTNAVAPSGIDATAFGRLHRSSAIWYADGEIADAAVWNADVATSTVRTLLRARWDPRIIAPTNLIGFTRLRTGVSPETDLIWTGTYTVTGASYSASNPLPATTKVEKTYSGRISRDDAASLNWDLGGSFARWYNTTGTVTQSIVSGQLKLAATDAANNHVQRGILDATSKGDQILGVSNCVISVDLNNVGASNGPAKIAIWKDAANWYDLAVAITAGGTSAIRKNGTNQQTAAKGIANGATKRVKFYKVGSSIGAVVDGQVITTFVDGTPLAAPFEVRVGAPNNGGGTSDWRLDNIDICESNTITIRDVPTGGSVRLYDSTGATVASGTETSGVVTLDCSSVPFPINGRMQVFTDSYTTPATSGELYASDFRGGDFYSYNSNVSVIGAEFIAQYATTQADSHNGAIIVGTMAYGVAYGANGSVLAWQKDLSVPGSTVITQIEPEGFISDQHAAISVQRDSSGFIHVAYGIQATYRKALAANDTQGWSTATNIAVNIGGGMLIDQADNLYLIGAEWYGTAGNSIVCYKKPAGGAWGSAQIIATALTPYMYYLCDVAIGPEQSGQKSIWASFFGYDGGSTYRDSVVIRSTDGGTNWKGLTGGNFTMPVGMTGGHINDSNAVAHTGDGAYITRLSIGKDLSHVHLAMWDLVAGYPKYKRGTIGTAWDAFSKNLNSVNTHGAMDEINNTLTYTWAGPSNNGVKQYLSLDRGTTWEATTQTLWSNPRASSPPSDYWAKLTPNSDGSSVYALWQSRGTTYRSASPNVTGEGCGSLFMTLWSLPAGVSASGGMLLTGVG